ncbi:hypothetical protein GH714_003950 [Hevea brasiliensis]|uniref:Uncharacterized protein n=1 Tax=Hevea brasiliensis TaxID=3981 RepID=A0A6A6KPK5_HEVBR|nr:hypothetical protein GH714_003950 [Hevea brasiliensis]
MKIQPIDIDCQTTVPARAEPVKPVLKSRLKRLFDRQFPGVLRISSVEKPSVGEAQYGTKDGGGAGTEFEPSSSLTPCATVHERNLLADTAMIVEKNKNHKQKDDLRKIVADGLSSLGYDSSICNPNGINPPLTLPIGVRNSSINWSLQGNPSITTVHLRRKNGSASQIVSIVSEAAKQSLKKKGMHFPPWRRAEYMRAKWLSSFTRQNETIPNTKSDSEKDECLVATEISDDCGELELIFGEKTAELDPDSSSPKKISDEDEKVKVDSATWQPPAVKPKSVDKGARMVTGLASLLKEKA